MKEIFWLMLLEYCDAREVAGGFAVYDTVITFPVLRSTDDRSDVKFVP